MNVSAGSKQVVCLVVPRALSTPSRTLYVVPLNSPTHDLQFPTNPLVDCVHYVSILRSPMRLCLPAVGVYEGSVGTG